MDHTGEARLRKVRGLRRGPDAFAHSIAWTPGAAIGDVRFKHPRPIGCHDQVIKLAGNHSNGEAEPQNVRIQSNLPLQFVVGQTVARQRLCDGTAFVGTWRDGHTMLCWATGVWL